jgi:tRNA pseudouridine32 synthase/23S rRNA pseudouridine746 synthase
LTAAFAKIAQLNGLHQTTTLQFMTQSNSPDSLMIDKMNNKPMPFKSTLFKPPMLDGLSASCIVLPAKKEANDPHQWHSILDFLIEHFATIDADQWHSRIKQQKVIDEFGNCIQLDTPYQPYAKIYYYRELAYEIEIPFLEQIIFENDDLLVVDKPHFLPVSPVGNYVKQSLQVRLKKRLNNEDLNPIHRLDRETAGVMLFSKNPESRHAYQQLFQQRLVEKTYHAIAPYQYDLAMPLYYQSRMIKGEPFFRMQETEGTPNSQTHIDILAVKDQWALYELKPITGRQHQLRVHLSSLGIPIKNDPFYPEFQPKDADDFDHPLQLLAKRISFIDPIQQQNYSFESNFALYL